MPRFVFYAIFIVVVLSVLIGSHYYFFLRLVRGPAWPAPWRNVAKWTIVCLGASVPLVFFLYRILPLGAARAILFIPYLWIGMMLLIAFFLLCADAIKLLGWLGFKVTGKGDWFAAFIRQAVTQRAVALGVVGITLVLTPISIHNAMAEPILHRIDVKLERLPESMDGFKIAQLTDLHLGPTLQRDYLENVVRLTNAQHPDLVVITGDLVDAPVDRLLPVLEPLTRLESEHGVFFVTGNHEFYAGPEEWLPALEKLGLRVLQNERVSIENDGAAFDLAGIHDLQGGRFSPDYVPDLTAALCGRNEERELVLLAHQSLIIDEAERQGVGLVLSGHNHGGQIWPWMHLVRLQQPYLSGLHRQGKTAIYVSQGTGFWGPPMRLGTRSEIALLTLQATGK